MKPFNKLIVYFLAAIPVILLIVFIVLFLRVNLSGVEKEIKTATSLQYINNEWSYSVTLSNDWERINRLISQIIWSTDAIQFQNNKKILSFQIHHNTFYEEDNKNLVKYVHDEAKYGEQNQGVKTETIKEISQTKKKWIVMWSGRDDEGHFIQYYAFDKSYPTNIIIHKLYFFSKESFNKSQKEEIEKVINNFNMF